MVRESYSDFLFKDEMISVTEEEPNSVGGDVTGLWASCGYAKRNMQPKNVCSDSFAHPKC